MTFLGAPLASGKMDWRTPEAVLDVVRGFDAIGLDPCTTFDNPVKALRWYAPPEANGLVRPWAGRGLVWWNPPYGRELGRWIEKAAYEAHQGAESIGLIPARPDTRAWQRWITGADAICFRRGRIRFVGAPASAPFPSALPYYGPRVARFLEAFGDVGWCVSRASGW